MEEFYRVVSSATEEQRQNLAELTNSGFGNSPDVLCNHIRYLRAGSIGQIFYTSSWKQIVTDVADQIGIDWNKLLNGRGWNDLSAQEIEAAVVARQFKTMLQQLSVDQKQHILMELKRERDDPHIEELLIGSGAMLTAKMSGFGVYLMASTVLGGLTSTLGITLPFAAYIGMSQTIALILGPIGWAAIAGGIVFSFNQPNWNRLGLAVLYVATLRHSET